MANLQRTVTDEATLLPALDQLPQTLLLCNLGPEDVYCGGADVTSSNGFTLPSGTTRKITNCREPIWGITLANTAAVNVVYLPREVDVVQSGAGAGSSGGSGTPGEAFRTQNIACVVASALGDPVTASGLTYAPVGPVQVYIDSQWRSVSYGNRTGFIFFGPDDATARAQGAILTTDLPRLGDAAIAASFTTDTSAVFSATYFNA